MDWFERIGIPLGSEPSDRRHLLRRQGIEIPHQPGESTPGMNPLQAELMFLHATNLPPELAVDTLPGIRLRATYRRGVRVFQIEKINGEQTWRTLVAYDRVGMRRVQKSLTTVQGTLSGQSVDLKRGKTRTMQPDGSISRTISNDDFPLIHEGAQVIAHVATTLYRAYLERSKADPDGARELLSPALR